MDDSYLLCRKENSLNFTISPDDAGINAMCLNKDVLVSINWKG
jgi:hypothetical protein